MFVVSSELEQTKNYEASAAHVGASISEKKKGVTGGAPWRSIKRKKPFMPVCS